MADGNIAAGTSTGGTLNKAPGRVGDSSLIGCGCYADNLQRGRIHHGMGRAHDEAGAEPSGRRIAWKKAWHRRMQPSARSPI